MYKSRLSKLEEKRNTRTAVLLILGTITIIIAGIFLGIPGMIKLARFFGDIRSAGGNNKTDLIPPPPPQILFSFDATNSATIKLNGLSEPESTIYLTQNSKPAGKTTAGVDGTYRFDQVSLADGSNKFSSVAIDEAGNTSLASTEVNIFYSNKEPQFVIDSPTDRQTVSGKNPVIEVKGSVDVSVSRLTINERFVIIGNDKRFTTTTALNKGDNLLVFVAVDRAGNQSRKEIIVKYE